MAQLIHGTTINGHIAIHAGNMSDHSLATTSYVTTQINNLINGAPGALNTLDELAAALGDDASFATSVTNSLGGKLSLTGGTLTGKVLFPSAVANRPQVPGGILGLDTGDGDFDIWGISRDYYPSHATAANAWGLRWNGANNDFEFVGGGTSRVILDMDGGNLTITGTISASGYNASNWNTAYGWGNHASAGYLTSLPSHNHDGRYLLLSGGTLTGDLLSTHPLYPGYNNGAVGSQGSYYLYGDTGNSGIRTNGNFLANGDIYLGTRGNWLSTYLNQAVRTDSAPSFSSVTLGGSQLTGTQVNGLSNMLGVTTLPYSCDITVGGDPDRFYAVQFWGGDQDVWRRIIIKRGYGETAPWDPIGTGQHHGGLLLDWEGNFGGWGGAEYADRLRVFNESYTNVCADMFIYSHSMSYVFMLRGGGAVYHLFSDQPINGFYQSGSPDILLSSGTLSYDDNWSGTNQYDVYAPAPLGLGSVNSSRIDGLRLKKQSLLDGRYLIQGSDISGISTISATNFRASNAFYLNGTSYYLNSSNGGIYTNARFESAGTIFASGGNSGNWNTAYGWGNHASAGYLTALPSHNHDDRYYTETEINNFSYWRNDEERRVKILLFTGEGGNSANTTQSYAIYQAGGAWTHPYPDLRIAFHTGIQIGANSSYGGTRFYNEYDMVTELMSVGNGDNHVRVANNLYVTGTITGSNLSGTNTGDQTNISGNAGTVTHNASRTDGTRYNIGWFAGNPSPAYSCDAVQIRSSDGTVFATSYRGSGNVSGTGEAIHAPAGLYSTGTNWLYGTIYMNNNIISEVGNITMISNVGIQYSTTHWIRPRDSSGNLHIKADSGGIYLDADIIHFRAAGGSGDTTISGGVYSGNISGNAATATNVAWTGVTSRPTALSQFTNDLGNYGGWITGYTETIGTNNTSGVAGAKYQINDTWLRVNSDNRQFQIYANSQSIIYRTDGVTNDHGGGGYPHIFYYGGSADAQRIVIFGTDGDIYVKYAGSWLSTLLAAKSNTGHTHDDRYYTETEINNFFSAATAITGYSKSNWDAAYNKRPTAISFSGTGTKTLTLTQGDGSTLTANFNDIDTDTNTDGQTLSLSGNTLSISGGNSVTLTSAGISQGTADSLYVNVSGDTMTGALTINSPGQGGEAFAVNGVNGRLFTVVDDLSDSLYSVNTLAGLPVLEVFANNIVQIGKFGTNAIYVGQDGRVGFGTTDFSYTASDNSGATGVPTNNRLFVNGSIQLLSNSDGIVFGRGTSTYLKDEDLSFGWGGGWYMTDGTYLRVRGNKMVYSGGSARFDGNIFVGNETYYFYGDAPNAGIRTNGSFLVNGDIYFGTRGEWLSTYLNQAVRTDSSPTFNDIYANNWFRNNGSNEGLYNQVTTQHLSSQANGYWDMSSTTSVSAIRFYTGGHVNSLRGHVYANSSNEIGFLNSAGNWGLRMDNSYNVQIYGTVSATNFSGSHSGTSSGTNTGDQTNISGNSGTTSQRSFDYLYASSYLESGGAVYGTIFYDNNERDYYADFNTTANSAIRVRGGMLMGPNPSWGAYLQVGGNGNESAYASVVTTNGNLHLDAADGRGTYINHYSGGTIYFGTAGTWTITGDGSYYNGTSAVANSVAWGNVSSRPTALSQFSNDLGNYGGWITSSGSISGNAATATTAARATRANGNFYIDDNYGNTVVGVYASTRLQGVFAMGDSYKLSADGTSAGALYGMAWSHPNAGGVAANLNTHGLLVMENGTFLAAVSGSIRARDDMRAPAIYDSGSRVAISRSEGRDYVNHSRYVYNNGAYSGTGWIEPSDLGVRYANSAGSAPNGANSNSAYNVTPGEGHGIKFWNSDSYKISMGSSGLYQYGPVTDYSIKMQMDDGSPGRGFTWGRVSYAPIAGLNGTSGDMQIAGTFRASNFSGTSSGTNTGDQTNISGNAATATNVAWTGVTSRPTALSQFSNDLGNYGSWITSSGSISGSSGSTSAVNNTGWGNGNFTWYQTPGGLAPYGGSWASFLISNHGDGSNYYNQTIIMPFWGAPQYSRREGGNNRGPWTFWSTENLDPNSISGNLAVSGSITAGADITAYSDIRLKTNVKTIENALDKTLALRGVSYNRTDSDDTKTKIGVIAQETLVVIPEVVSQDSNGMYSVAYSNMTALLIEAIKEQQAQIEELKTEVKKLRGE